jgi:4-diphosphocytidyl-2-C-methyl-D-erythritol kinase
MADLILRPSAKINLALHVGARREDGYHDVRTVLQSIALCDVIRIRASRGPFTLTTTAPGLPVDETNLVWRAAQALWTALRRNGPVRQARVAIDKRIPIGAGLGGGSADAAAALVGLHRLWKGRLAPTDLLRVATSLGSDVPFFLVGGTALGINRGDDLYPLVDARRWGVVLIQPPFAIATADAYRWFDEQGPDRAAGAARGASRAVETVRLGWPTRPLAVVNDLQGPVAAHHPVIADMVWACRSAGAEAAGMTGSGSVVFGLFELGAVAQAARELGRKSDRWRVLATRTLARRDATRRIGL